MKILKAFKTELKPNDGQLTLLKKSAGAARLAGIQAYGDGSVGMFDVEHTKLPSVN